MLSHVIPDKYGGMDERKECLYALEALSVSMNRQSSLRPEFVIDSLAELPFFFSFPYHFASPIKMTILVLGGRGTTSSRISPLLSAAKVPFLIASRSSDPDTPYIQATFDWLDEKTYGNPFETASSNGLDSISGVYMVSPPILDVAPPMNAFIDFAREKGVKRFVLMSASTITMGDVAMGKVHERIASLDDVEWAVLRPTWFMGMYYLELISYLPGFLTNRMQIISPRRPSVRLLKRRIRYTPRQAMGRYPLYLQMISRASRSMR